MDGIEVNKKVCKIDMTLKTINNVNGYLTLEM